MKVPELTKYSKEMLVKIQTKQIRFEPKDMPKIEAYLQMIVARGEIISKDTMRMQKFMEDIQEGIIQLERRGVRIPDEVLGIKPNVTTPPKVTDLK